MNKAFSIAKKFAIVGLVLIVIGLIAGKNALDNKGDFERRTYECASVIDTIRIEDTANCVEIIGSDVAKTTVSYSEKKGVCTYDLVEKNGTLKLERKSKGISFGASAVTTEDTRVIITVPMSIKGDIKINTTSGSISITDVHADDVALSSTSGAITLTSVEATDIVADNTSGSKNLTGCSAKKVRLDATSGSLQINDLVCSDIRGETTSGSIKFEGLNCDGNVSLNSTSGSVKGTLTGSQTEYTIDVDTTSGSSNIKYYKGGSRKLHVKTTSGSVNLGFEG